MVSIAMLLLTTLLTAAAAPVAAPPIAPTGPWNVEAQEDQCILSRQYGLEGARELLAFQPIIAARQLDLIVALRAERGAQSVGKAVVTRLPDGAQFPGTYVRHNANRNGLQVTRVSLDRTLFEELDRGTGPRVEAGSLARAFTVGRQAKAQTAFATCERELLVSWGVDPATLTGARPSKPVGNPGRYFGPNSYPSAARNAGFIGRVTAVLNIDPSGKVTRCRPIVAAGEALTKATCDIALRVPFEPATDAAGKAITSFYILRVRWDIGSGLDFPSASRINN